LREAPGPIFCTSIVISGKMPFSSQASRELSTASFSVVSTALAGDEKPTCCRFLAKYSAVLLEVIFDTPLAPRVVVLFDGTQPHFRDRQVFFERITLFTGDDNIFLRALPATREWNKVFHRQLIARKFLFTKIANSFAELLFPPIALANFARFSPLTLHVGFIDGFNILI
jgi:hypothetical protein